jgi:hypothetical protein
LEIAGLSHGFGDDRDSAGADKGVGSVEVVMFERADLGVGRVVDAERGVNGVLVMESESSVRAERIVGSSGVLPDRSRLDEYCFMR